MHGNDKSRDAGAYKPAVLFFLIWNILFVKQKTVYPETGPIKLSVICSYHKIRVKQQTFLTI